MELTIGMPSKWNDPPDLSTALVLNGRGANFLFKTNQDPRKTSHQTCENSLDFQILPYISNLAQHK